MNSLDELFGAALDRESLQATAERRAAVADAAVRGARRQRRVRGTFQAVAIVAVIGAGAVVGSQYLGNDAVTPADPTPSASAPVVEVVAQGTTFADEDPRMALEPEMTAEDWAAVDASWDIEFASLRNSDGETSTVQWYLTGPDGDRKFALVDREFPLLVPQLLAFDPESRTAVVFDEDAKTLNTVVVADGSVSEIAWALDSSPQSGSSLGRAAEGSSIYVLNVTDADGAARAMVFRMDGDTAASIVEGALSASQVWGDWVIVKEADALSAIDVTTPGSARPLADTSGCEFVGWTTSGEFQAWCDVDGDGVGNVVEGDPATGDHTTVAEDVSTLAGFDADWLPVYAIDSTRTLTGPFEDGGKTVPPVVFEGGDESRNLATGFFPFPDTFTVIFGARG